MENITIAKVCGLCAGCNRAIFCTKQELEKNKNVVIFKEIVHNNNVNEMLKNLGAKIENDLQNLNNENTVIIRAHGEPPSTYAYLEKNKINYIDCTCPNVLKIHQAVQEFSNNNHKIILIGKFHSKIHPEVEGTMGWIKSEPILIENEEDLVKLKNLKNENVYLVCQTTFNMKKATLLIKLIKKLLKKNHCKIIINNSICNAQKVINTYSKKLAKKVDVMIVVGGKKSSNSIELYANVKKFAKTIFIEDINTYKQELAKENITLTKSTKIGITAGASTMKEELIELKKLIEQDLQV